MCGDPDEVDPAAAAIDLHQEGEAAQKDGVGVGEVDGKDSVGLGGEELCLLRTQVIQAEEHFRGAGYNDASAGHGNRRG